MGEKVRVDEPVWLPLDPIDHPLEIGQSPIRLPQPHEDQPALEERNDHPVLGGLVEFLEGRVVITARSIDEPCAGCQNQVLATRVEFDAFLVSDLGLGEFAGQGQAVRTALETGGGPGLVCAG